jgi:NTP pyrophosphatase (non-canonical NTP hydrolase)
MNWKTYQEDAFRTNANIGTKSENNVHMILGMLTEVGELADVFKKNMAYGKEIDWVNVKEELFDLMWYVAGFCKFNEIDFEEGLQTNINKLRQRYPDKFTKELANNRDIAAERKILES